MASGTTIRRAGRPVRLGAQLGEILVRARGDRSRREVAEAAGVAPATLAEVERGRANPTLAYLEALGAVYGVELSIVAVPGG